jgi:hypothetical protein
MEIKYIDISNLGLDTNPKWHKSAEKKCQCSATRGMTLAIYYKSEIYYWWFSRIFPSPELHDSKINEHCFPCAIVCNNV